MVQVIQSVQVVQVVEVVGWHSQAGCMKDVTTTGDLSKVELRNRRWHVESTGSTEPPISPELVRIRLQTCLSPIHPLGPGDPAHPGLSVDDQS